MPQMFSSGQTSASTTTPNFLPGQEALLQQLFAQYSKALGMGTTPTQSDKNALMTQINNSYSQMAPALTSQLTSQGFGSSGNLGAGELGIQQARTGAQEQGMESLNSQAMQRYLSLIGMGPSMGAPFGGQSSTGSVTQNPSILSDLGSIGGMLAPFATMGLDAVTGAPGGSLPNTSSMPSVGAGGFTGLPSVPSPGTPPGAGMPSPYAAGGGGIPSSAYLPSAPNMPSPSSSPSFATPAAGGGGSGGSGGGGGYSDSPSPFAPIPGSGGGGGGYSAQLPQFG